MKLSADQQVTFDAIIAWLYSRGLKALGQPKWVTSEIAKVPILTVGGLAGTGKTTVVSHLATVLQDAGFAVAYVAFTGRAFSVLAKKMAEAGVETATGLARQEGDHGDRYFVDEEDSSGVAFTGTIHRLLYKPVVDEETEELRGFVPRTKLDRRYDLVVVDEASMVSDEILRDLSSKGVPLLAVGDHGQLPPVMAPGELMKHPALRLEKIHRQAEGNPIIALASAIRNGERLPRESRGTAIEVRSKSEAARVLAEVYGAHAPIDVGVVCWTNRTRVALNSTARGVLGRKGTPLVGEVVLCLKNIHSEGIFNGMRGVLMTDGRLGPSAQEPWRDPWILEAEVEFPDVGGAVSLEMCAAQFARPDTFKSVEELQEAHVNVKRFGAAGHLITFGYAMTVHKAQGSGFSTVVLYADRPEDGSEDTRKFYYTAVTRAAEKLIILR